MKFCRMLAAGLLASTALTAAPRAQQKLPGAELFASYRNDVLAPTDPRLAEAPGRRASADDILSGRIKWRNPYPVVRNDAADEGFDASRLGGPAPAPGVYPRLFTSPADFPAIRARLLSTNVGRRLRAVADRELASMRRGEGSAAGRLYASLLAPGSAAAPEVAAGPFADMSNRLAVQALLAQLDGNAALLEETGRAAASLLRSQMREIDRTPPVEGREDMVKESVYKDARIAKLFDFAAAGMPAADREPFLSFYGANTRGRYGDGMQLPPHWRRWNHIGMSLLYPFSALILEGRKDFDKRIYDRGVEVLGDYLSYTFSPEGMSNEGITYTFNPFADDMLLMAAVARRGGPNTFANPRFRAIPDWLVQTLSPDPRGRWYSAGDTGSVSQVSWLQMMIMKHFFPRDGRVDYLLANSLPKDFAALPDVAAFVFAADPDRTAADYAGIPPGTAPSTFFSPSRGSFIARDKWGADGVQFRFDARQDMYFQSHDHADRGNFMLAANGRWWVVDGWRSTESKYHAVITIDGRGQGYFATPAEWLGYVDKPEATFGVVDYKYSFDWRWLKSPVADRLLGREVEPQWRTGVYADSADRMRRYFPDARPERDPLRKVAEYFSDNLGTNPLIWNEDTWVMRIPNYPVERAFRTAGLVKGRHPYALVVDDLKKDNQERLYEWLMPMPLDVEVVSIRQNVEITQGTSPRDIGVNFFRNKGVAGDYDILLGDKRMARNEAALDEGPGEQLNAGRFMPRKGDPQLLVRVLARTPSAIPELEPNPRLETIEKLKTDDMHQFYLRSMDLGKRLVVPSRSTDPGFKVLLFPHLSGEPLPETRWNDDRTVLSVSWADQKDVFYFSTDSATGRTKVRLVRDGAEVFAF